MTERNAELVQLIVDTVRHEVMEADTVTPYRDPLVGFADAYDPRFDELRRVADPRHMMPADLLPGARSVVSFFVPFDPQVVEANAREQAAVAEEWAVAYVETNDLIGQITDRLIELLAAYGVRASAEPATGNFDIESLTSRWSHKSVAVIAGLGSFGLHQMIITEAGCAGRLGSLVTDVELRSRPLPAKERCLHFHDGSCGECVRRCPVNALSKNSDIDRERCWSRCLEVAEEYAHLGVAQACGKCAIGPCSFEAAVQRS